MTPLPTLLAELLERGDVDGAFRVLEPHRAALTTERHVAAAWLELLELTPDRPTLVDEANAVLTRWPDDARLVIAACAALLARAQRIPPDEPSLAEGPARLAAEAAERALSALGPGDRKDPEFAGYLYINLANALRIARLDEERAVAAYRAALELAPENGHWWFDFGVFAKWRARFDESLSCMEKARALLGDTKPVLWNLAIAATALGRGEIAVEAWTRLGLDAKVSEASGMPFVDPLPPLQVRVPARGTGTAAPTEVPDRAASFELLWVSPISPCHGVVATPTAREAMVDYGDVVLWDGAPVSVVRDGDRPVPRFPLLAMLRRGDERRFRFVGLQQQAGDVDALEADLPEGSRIFVHEERVEYVCARCASGDVLRKHEHTPPEEHRIVYGKIIVPGAVRLEVFRDAYENAIRQRGKVALALPGLYEALGDTKKAGQQHVAWGGIERAAIKRGLAGPRS